MQKKPFVGFIVGGDGGVDYSVACCLKLIEAGVDILEIGMPFSDPVADGPTIQKASSRSLNEGTSLFTILNIARRIREVSQVPLVLFTYFNPLLQKGTAFLKEIKKAGFNAILIVDLAPSLMEKNNSYFEAIKEANLQSIFLVSPSTSEERLQKITKMADGFIYYACQKGTTGVKDKLPDDLSFQISRIRQRTDLPIAAGFGIADQHNARSALQFADAFVVGSAFVKLMEKKADPEELKAFAKSIDPRGRP
jgi:tryptophan synthase alpha chain